LHRFDAEPTGIATPLSTRDAVGHRVAEQTARQITQALEDEGPHASHRS